MRIVHITQSSPIQMYFANILNQTHPLYAIFIENVWANNWRRYKKKVRKNIEKHGLHTLPKQLIEGTYLYYQNKMVHKTERDFFFSDSDEIHFTNQCPQYQVGSVNEADAVKRLKEIQPDVITVFGASILRKRVIRIPKQGVLNLHNGILPQYRGAKSEFWALYNNEPHMIGATVHCIDEGVDTGQIVIHEHVTPQSGDNERILRCRTTQVGVKMMGRALDQIETGTLTKTLQDSTNAGYYTTPSMQAYRQVHKMLKEKKYDFQ